MAGTRFDLQDLRRRLDAVDDRLHELLIERAQIVSMVADHKRTSGGSFYQPAREAEIIRRLAARHHGPLAVASLVRVWREMLAASVGLEAPFAVAVYVPAGSAGLWDLARDHYGGNTPLSPHASTAEVIRAVSEAQASVGVLPLPREDEPDPWWPHLPAAEQNRPRVLARLPFGPRGNARGCGTDALVIGRGAQEPTGRDRTLLVAQTAGIGRTRILGLLTMLGLDCTFSAACERPGGTAVLIELEGFVALADPRVEGFRAPLGSALHRLSLLGGYAVPLQSAPVAPAAAIASGSASSPGGGFAK